MIASGADVIPQPLPYAYCPPPLSSSYPIKPLPFTPQSQPAYLRSYRFKFPLRCRAEPSRHLQRVCRPRIHSKQMCNAHQLGENLKITHWSSWSRIMGLHSNCEERRFYKIEMNFLRNVSLLTLIIIFTFIVSYFLGFSYLQSFQ
jgi:hypothetical protein